MGGCGTRAMRTVARTIFLKSPLAVRALERGGQLVDRAQVAGRLLGAAERVAEPLRRRAARHLGAAGQARRQAGDAVERAVDVGAGQRRRSRRPAGRRRCRASARRRRSARRRSRSDPSCRWHVGAARVRGVLREALARRQARVDGRRPSRRCPAGAAAAAWQNSLARTNLPRSDGRRLVGLGVLGQERPLRQQAGRARRDRGRRAGSRRRAGAGRP